MICNHLPDFKRWDAATETLVCRLCLLAPSRGKNKPKRRATCLHCKTPNVLIMGRNLCHKCYQKPEVRKQYKRLTNHTGKRNVDVRPDFNGAAKPCRPTRTLPGTGARLRQLQRRAARGEELTNAADAVRNDCVIPATATYTQHKGGSVRVVKVYRVVKAREKREQY